MAYNHSISVKVCGNPESSGGFGPILLLNNPSFVVEDQFYVGFDKNSFFFTITTQPTQTVYKLVKNNVRSSGAFRAGSLVIAISIPKNYKLEGGYTPYDVLCALKDEFLKKCMTCKDPVRETYEYNAGKIDGHVLDEVVEKFSLTPFDMPNRVMTTNGPVGYIVATEEKIKELFQDVNYPEFDKFKEVVVATTVHTTSYVLINNIQIPRPQKYEVIVDGKRKGFYSNLNEKIPVECHSKSSDYYDNLSWEFSIQDLIDGYVRHQGVTLYTGQERVVVNTDDWGKPKEKEVFLAISPEESKDYFIRNPQKMLVTLVSSYALKEVKVFQQRLLVITLSGNEIAALKNDGIQVATTQGSIYKVKKWQLVEEDELHVDVEPRKLPSPPPAGYLTVNVTFPEDKDLRGIRSVDLQAKNCINNQDVFSVSPLSLKRSSENEGYNGKFKIGAKTVPPCDFYLKCSIKNEVWKTEEIKRNEKSVTVAFVKTHRPFTERYRKPLVCVLVTMMALVLGGLSFVLYNNKLRNENEQENAQQEVFTRQAAYNFMNDVGQNLSEKQLAFDMVDSLYEVYENHKDTIKKYVSKDICDYLCDYKKATDFVRKGDILSIKMVVDPQNKYKLYHTHLDVLKLIVEIPVNEGIFRSRFSQLKCFDDIAKLYKGAQKASIPNNINDKNEIPSEQFKCSQCKLWFKTEDELTKHQTYACEKNKYVCKQCWLRFKSKVKLQQHKNDKHPVSRSTHPQQSSVSNSTELEFEDG
uniref:hypothetical protein n=2 Tax=Prevotella sp. TaxID=59823 RepID=UPI00402710CA